MSGWRIILGVATLAILAVAALFPTLAGGFLWDDRILITENNLITSQGRLWMFWFSTVPYDYFPLTSTTWWLEYRIFGEHPLGYRLVNLALHAGSAMLIWRLLPRLGMSEGAAFAAAAIWVVHPIHLQSVAWIAERKNTLSLFLALLAAMAFVNRGRTMWLSVPVFAAACLAKTSVVALPVVLAILWWWRAGFFTRDRKQALGAMVVIAAALSVVTIYYQSQHAIGHDVVRDDSILSRLLIAARAAWFYVGTTLLPVNLSFAHPRWVTGVGHWANLLAGITLAMAVLAVALQRRQLWAMPVTVICTCYLLLLSPVLGLINIYFMKYSLVSEHWQYPAGVVLVSAVVALISRWQLPQVVRLGLLWGVLLLLILRAHQYAPTYLSEESLWKLTAERNPSLVLAHDNLSAELLRQGRLDEAFVSIRRSLELDENGHIAWTNFGRLTELRGDALGALASYSRAQMLKPDSADAAFNLGQAQARLGDLTAARESLELAIRLDPSHSLALNNLAMVLWQQQGIGSTEQRRIESLLRQQIEVNHRSIPARVNLATLLAATGRLDEAERVGTEGLQLAGQTPPATLLNLLGGLAGARQDATAAESYFRRAMQVDPSAFEPLQNLAMLLAKSGRTEEAAEVARRALAMRPGDERMREISGK